jgi:hypothetical protein
VGPLSPHYRLFCISYLHIWCVFSPHIKHSQVWKVYDLFIYFFVIFGGYYYLSVKLLVSFCLLFSKSFLFLIRLVNFYCSVFKVRILCFVESNLLNSIQEMLYFISFRFCISIWFSLYIWHFIMTVPLSLPLLFILYYIFKNISDNHAKFLVSLQFFPYDYN